jgi:hypothetical protein
MRARYSRSRLGSVSLLTSKPFYTCAPYIERMPDLSPGDFLYQSDQELFLVVVEENDNSYKFAAHGWRDIDKDRLDEYIEDSRSKVHKSDEIESVIEEKGDDDDERHFNRLKQLFSVYEDVEFAEDGLHEEFALDET